jgi:uncharacterized NAD-dependent epimerase/dehydratase family protein
MVILAEGRFSSLESKTANQAIRYISEQVVGIIDSTKAGMTARQVVGFGGDIPVYADLGESLRSQPNTLLIGIAPTGGQLPDSWRSVVRQAIEHRLDVISGLHALLSEDGEFSVLAARCGVEMIDLRKTSSEYEVIAKGTWKTRHARTILTVGTDCNVGKMTASLELHREFLRQGKKSDFVATGQTGILLAGKGIAVDHLISDFVAGAIELAIDRSVEAGSEFVFVEGQGALTHQGYSAVTLGLMHGVMPDAMILVHHPARRTDDYGLPLDDINRFIRLHEEIIGLYKETKVAGIAVNGAMMTAQQVAAAVTDIEARTGLPAVDVLTGEVWKLADAVMEALTVPKSLKI